MNLHDAELLAADLMDLHLDESWSLAWTTARRRYGSCNFTTRQIRLSRPLTELGSEAAFQDTVLHEIAHALAGHAAGHGPVWKRIARRIGADPSRTSDGVRLPRRFVGNCDAGHGPWKRDLRRRGAVCGRCRGPIRWQRNPELAAA